MLTRCHIPNNTVAVRTCKQKKHLHSLFLPGPIFRRMGNIRYLFNTKIIVRMTSLKNLFFVQPHQNVLSIDNIF